MRFRLIKAVLISVLAAAPALASSEPCVSRAPVSGVAGDERPVVLVNGFGANCLIQWTCFALGLWEKGYDPYCMNFSSYFMGIEFQALELADFIDEVLEDTGAGKVDIAAGSMGGLIARYYVAFLGGIETVEDVVLIASPNHGTWSAFPYAWLFPSCRDMTPGSDFLVELNSIDETPGDDILYSSIRALIDQSIDPDRSAILDGARNVRVWNCIGHQTLFIHDDVFDLLVEGLEGGGSNDN